MADQETSSALTEQERAYIASLPPITYVSANDLTPELQARRAEDMRNMYYDPENPMSMIDIGIVYGLTRERVRQIFKQFDIPVRPRPEARAIAQRRREKIAAG